MRGILKKVTVLISYAYARIYLESFARIAENPHVELLLDSGAFTAKNTGQDIRLEDYCDFLRTWKHRICRYISLDVIGDPKQTDFNFREMVRAGFSPVPVHVLGDNKRRMDELFELSDYVALGGLKRPGKGSASKSYVVEKMRWAAGRKVHWLGYTKPAMLTALHPYSCDCSSWNAGFKYGKMDVYLGAGVWRSFSERDRHLIVADRKAFNFIGQMGYTVTDVLDKKKWHGRPLTGSLLGEINIDSYIRYSLEIRRLFGTRLYLALNGDARDESYLVKSITRRI